MPLIPQLPPTQGHRLSIRGATCGIPRRGPDDGGFLLEQLMSGPRDDRIAAQQRWGGAGHGARMPLARRLQAPMRPRFFPRDVYGPAADPPGPDRLGWMGQVGRPQGRWLTTRVGIAHATPAEPHGWRAGVRPHGALGRHCYHAG